MKEVNVENIECIDTYIAEMRETLVIAKANILARELHKLLENTNIPLTKALERHLGINQPKRQTAKCSNLKQVRLDNQKWAEIKKKKLDGVSVLKLSEEYGVAQQTIYARCCDFKQVKELLKCVKVSDGFHQVTYKGLIIPVYGNLLIKGETSMQVLNEVKSLTKNELMPIINAAIKKA